MMNSNLDKTLLALLLALHHLDADLAADDMEALEELGELLEDDPEAESVSEEVEAICAANPALEQLYREALTKLAPLDEEKLASGLPPTTELEKQLEITERDRGYVPKGTANRKSRELVNISREIMKRDRPDRSAKKLEFLQQYWELPQTPI
ncbi:hypothetical protein [Phormidium sp. CCY1219]|uniref:hypothetical protein n=1 Tax=Phormidium sp. CCY1219 TaxID=2886104 RepID=UPI002D1F2FB0|nr:hypothetical protein [Phormidium sp. CCY1219]MEB3825981.1 hypothetical protein [Phormidium sp. CCY1219]